MAVLIRMLTVNRFGFVILLSLLIILNLFPHPVFASGSTGYGGENWLEADDYDYFPIEMDTGGGKLDYSIEVHSGPRLDIFLFDEDNYNAYVNGEPADYIEKGSSLDRYNVVLSTNLEKNDYYLVLDNTNFGAAAPPSPENGGVSYEYEIGYTTDDNILMNIDWTWMVLGAIFFIAIVIMISLFIINKIKK